MNLIYPDDFENKILCGDCIEIMREIPNNSIDLIVTSSPYNIKVDYENYIDDLSFDKYLNFMQEWIAESYRILKDGSRLCIVLGEQIRDSNQRHSMLYHSTDISLKLGFLYHGMIVWYKKGMRKRTAWGSYLSPNCPYVVHPFEFILIFSKNRYGLNRKGITDITREEFIKWSYAWWDIGRDKENHPAAFPIELPMRLIKFLTFVDDLVLDPFFRFWYYMYSSKKFK